MAVFVDEMTDVDDDNDAGPSTIEIKSLELKKLVDHPGTDGSWGNIITKVKNKEGLISLSNGMVSLTKKGQEQAANARPRFTTNEEKQEYLMEAKIKKGPVGLAKKVFSWLCDGETRSHDEIATYLSKETGKEYDANNRSFGNIITCLRGKADLVENVGSNSEKKIRLKDSCFLKGQRP